MSRWMILFVLSTLWMPAFAEKECWTLTNLKGKAAYSNDGYAFSDDRFSNPMLLCFDLETQSGSVSGDDTRFTMFGASTLAGWATNRDIELFEVYQIDRAKGKVLFTRSRIGTASLIPSMPDVVAAYVGKAVKIH